MLKLKRFVVNYVNPNFSGVGTRDYRHAKLADAINQYVSERNDEDMVVFFGEREGNDYYYSGTIEDSNGERVSFIYRYASFEVDRMFRDISHAIAFNDISWVEIDRIICDGREVRYAGWRPGMHIMYEWAGLEPGAIAWEGCFPEWDH